MRLFLSVDEVATALGVVGRTVKRLVAGDEPELASVKVAGRRLVHRRPERVRRTPTQSGGIVTYTAAERAHDQWRLSQGHDAAKPWDKRAEQLLAAVELLEASARSRAARAVVNGADPVERARTRTLSARATALTNALARRKALGAVTPAELERAIAAATRIRSGELTTSEIAQAERARVASTQRRRAAVEAEMEATGSVAEMAQAMTKALEAENLRAYNHAQRLDSGANCLGGAPYLAQAEQVHRRAYRALVTWHEQRDAGAVVTTGEWRAAVNELAGIRSDMDDFESMLRVRRGEG